MHGNDASLINVKPGSYMKLLSNRMLRVQRESHGLCLNDCKDGPYHIVLVCDELILIKRKQRTNKEIEDGNEQ
jgi:hypothetical protein